VFEAVNNADQDMTSTLRASALVYAGQTMELYVSLRPQDRQTTAGIGFRWACLEMSKKAPTANSKYVMKPPQDDVLVRLGAITNRAAIRGPHDQARMWIYTDKATLAQVNERLIPGVTEGRYMTLLWELATQGGVDLTAPDYRRVLEPRLLTGVPIDDRAGGWLVSVLAEAKARDLSRYVNSNAAMIVRSIESDPQFGPGYVATVTTAMLSEDDADVRKAGMRLLSAVAPSARESFARAGGLEGLRNVVVSGTPAEVVTAVDLLILYRADWLLGAVWEQLPTEALKTKAKKQLGIE
jgi:hypothetical protein